MSAALALGIYAGCFLVALLVAVPLCVMAARGDRAEQAREDELRAREGVRAQRTVHAEPKPRRRNGGGWVV